MGGQLKIFRAYNGREVRTICRQQYEYSHRSASLVTIEEINDGPRTYSHSSRRSQPVNALATISLPKELAVAAPTADASPIKTEIKYAGRRPYTLENGVKIRGPREPVPSATVVVYVASTGVMLNSLASGTTTGLMMPTPSIDKAARKDTCTRMRYFSHFAYRHFQCSIL